MGKQKQHRRSAKKKGGKKGEASGQNDETVEEMVKCTACGQLVQPEDTVACPIPECDRSFCTDKCAESCIIGCADPICPCPNRCRPCASGTTLEQLERRNQPRLSSVHTPYTNVAGAKIRFAPNVCTSTFAANATKKYVSNVLTLKGASSTFASGLAINVTARGVMKDSTHVLNDALSAQSKPSFLPRAYNITSLEEKCVLAMNGEEL